MTTIEVIGVVTAAGAVVTALATGLSYFRKLLSKPKLRYRIDEITGKGNYHVNRGKSGNEDLGPIVGKAIRVENRGSYPAEGVTVHVRTNSRLLPAPELDTNIKGRTLDIRTSEVYLHVDRMRAKGGRLVLRVFVLQNDLDTLGRSKAIADYEVSHSFGKAKQVKKLKYLKE